jgi:hypothetical protein
VVAAAHREQSGPLGSADAALVLKHHLDGDFNAHRPRVGKEHVLQGRRSHGDKPLGQPHGWCVGQAAEHHVTHPPCLL